MKSISSCLIIVILFSSCNEGSTNEKTVFVTDTTRVQDTIIFVKDSTMATTFADSLPSGAYQGMFPCDGCDGIQQTIIFATDKTYKEERMLWGKNETPKSS